MADYQKGISLLRGGGWHKVAFRRLSKQTLRPCAARVRALFGRVCRDQQAVTLVEYGLLACMVAVAMILALSGLANTLVDTLDKVSGNLPVNQVNTL
jgi:Flp pilus assembly pilin Flp